MKVYVDESPKGKDIRCEIDSMVLAIDMSDKDKSYLMIGDKGQDNNFRVEFCSDNEVLVNCVAKILEHLTDYTKQVRKEVAQKFVEQFMLEYTMGNEPVEDIIYKVLDQIQGETK